MFKDFKNNIRFPNFSRDSYTHRGRGRRPRFRFLGIEWDGGCRSRSCRYAYAIAYLRTWITARTAVSFYNIS